MNKKYLELLDEHVSSFLNPRAHTQLSSTQTDEPPLIQPGGQFSVYKLCLLVT